jgi:hypothetical protein
MLPAMIVMIVAYLAPSVAEAHPGHGHPPPATVSAPEAILASHASAAPSEAVAIASVLYQEETDSSVSVANFDGPGPFNRCTGPCCCNVSMSCYAHALTADTGGTAVTGPTSRLIATPDDLARSGVDPEALPKPPRTFA